MRSWCIDVYPSYRVSWIRVLTNDKLTSKLFHGSTYEFVLKVPHKLQCQLRLMSFLCSELAPHSSGRLLAIRDSVFVFSERCSRRLPVPLLVFVYKARAPAGPYANGRILQRSHASRYGYRVSFASERSSFELLVLSLPGTPLLRPTVDSHKTAN